MVFSKKRNRRVGFTLVQILIVIGILGVLSTIVILIINPIELIRRSRDSNRQVNIANFVRAIELIQFDKPTLSLGNPKVIYVSLPDPAASPTSTCSGLGLEAPAGWMYECRNSNQYRNVNGNGWLPMDFTSFSGGSLFPSLPVDPINSASQNLFYAYIAPQSCPGIEAGGYVFTARLEAQKNRESQISDAGTDPARFETGEGIPCWGTALGLIGYWKFDEVDGGTNKTPDASTYGNSGNVVNSPSLVAGKVGNALDFVAASQQEVNMPGVLPISTDGTLMGWFLWKGDNVQEAAWFRDSVTAVDFWVLMFQKIVTQIYFTAAQDTYSAGLSLIPYKNAWHHFALTKDGNTVRYYIDGNMIYENLSSPGTTASVSPWHIMKNVRLSVMGWPKYDSGTADEIRIYSRALTSQEIKDYYNATK